MRLTLLGTGADHCIPAFRCNCDVCSEARRKKGKYIRQNSCAFLETKTGGSLLIDMPPQIMPLLAANGIDDSNIDGVLVTHRHEDHTLGLRYLFHGSERKNFTVKKEADLFIPATSLASVSGKLLSGKNKSLFTDRKDYFKINRTENGVPFYYKNLYITPVETGHLAEKADSVPGEESFGYIIREEKGSTLVYFLDAAETVPESTLALLKKVRIDCLIADCTYRESNNRTGHMDIEAVLRLKTILSPGITVASHISHMNLGHGELESILAEKGITAGYDGMVLEI